MPQIQNIDTRLENCYSKNIKKRNSDTSGIILLKKTPGITSFSSLSSIKRALKTTKVGHTGTLDSFATGLLVVLVGKLTHLVPHITNFGKTYKALISFGSETDTLDPTGTVIKTGKIPTKEEVESVLPQFFGEIEQIPPAFSAIHVDGKRASDLARNGKEIELKPRKITIFSIKLLDFYDTFAQIEVSCSKGTYIRSLARDIAEKCGTVAHLKELERTKVGPFSLDDAVTENDDEIRSSVISMTPEIARLCGMDIVFLQSSFVSDFCNGRPLKDKMFVKDFHCQNQNKEVAVFYSDGEFAGVINRKIEQHPPRLSYGFVIQHEPKMKIYSWEQIQNGKFNAEFAKKGVALTIGSFDGSHLGHRSLFEAVLSQKENGLVPGVLTFTKSLRGYKKNDGYKGDVISLSQKVENLSEAGFEFAIIVDFSVEFGKIEGRDFFSLLSKNCGLQFLAEGIDFHCGYKGSTGIEEIKRISADFGFVVETIDSVILEGERVSSSRIRDCVLKKDFAQTQNMLLKPFELDVSSFDWKIESEKVISASKEGVQLLPPNGTYGVKVRFYQTGQLSGEAQKDRAAVADCTLENGNLRLAFSDNLISGFVRSIQFL